jgi:hypothetical protein
MNKKEIEKLAELYLTRTINLLGESKYYAHTPYLTIEYSPNSEGVDNDWKGEFVSEDNEIIIYTKNITSKSDLAKTIVHEYAHYLQSPNWMSRYYKLGYNYRTHPYEKQAFLLENLNWFKICK